MQMRLNKFMRWAAALVFLVAFLICANYAACNTWAASFHENPNTEIYKRHAYWCLAGMAASLACVVYFVWPRKCSAEK
jgi:hypothetical protein